ncbi:MAG: hypothetical protein PHC85_02985 [Candidatus Pacebacteria bacterium]|nr:hypothetical protein [Candidatus Paceibacterota bacterium]
MDMSRMRHKKLQRETLQKMRQKAQAQQLQGKKQLPFFPWLENTS